MALTTPQKNIPNSHQQEQNGVLPLSSPPHFTRTNSQMIERLEGMISQTSSLLFTLPSNERRYDWKTEKQNQTQLQHIWRPKNLRAKERREMVSACRALRMQIKKFEDEFLTSRGHAPRGAERAPLASTYRQYREWKRDIRDHAANHIQSLVRAKSAWRKKELLLREKENSTRSSEKRRPRSTLLPAVITATDIQSLSAEKRKLKQQLKQYDQRFFDLHGRMPNKIEKEPIRNLYEQYHDIKTRLIQAEALHKNAPSLLLHTRSLSSDGGLSPTSSTDHLNDPLLQRRS
uniref:FAM13A-like domain-containing protein n=1 Tax=Aureoumbra lagunensis TaxID=44058 RepID=A0A7S3NPK6_9STRA|mmetsp:Transcript_13787/g.20602  ORF Transcript_13787/g.20602 Transcript_13787/m.20602 type:complete len:289 (-) Transcript_13787:373-1239(-)